MVEFINFKLLYPSIEKDREDIFEELLSGGMGNDLPAQRILDMFLPGGKQSDSANCQTIIIEKEYVCYDYMDSYVRYYCYAHRDYPKRCRRVHFFGSKVEEQDLLGLSKEQRDSYLGFVVVRPTEAFKIGRTAVAPLLRGSDQYFILLECEYPVNLAGNDLKACGAIFMQQDTQVAACASASVWMTACSLSQRFELPRYTTTQITEMATRSDVSLGRAVPSPGLTIAQMLEALRSMGHEPIVYGPQGTEELKATIYKYVEGQIPVILGLAYPGMDGKLSGHSLVVIGHSYTANSSPRAINVLEFNEETQKRSTAFSFYPSTEWVPCFLVNDDARGPYRTVEILDPALPDVPRELRELAQREGLSSVVKVDQEASGMVIPPLYAAVSATMVALPKSISLPAGKAEIKAIRLIVMAHRLLGWPYPEDLVLRTYLRLSSEFKSGLDRTLDASEKLKALYRDMPMPKYVWVTEMSTKEWMNKDDPRERLRFGEILIDASASPWTEDFVTVHVMELFMHMGPNEDNPELAILNRHPIPDDRPYPHLARSPHHV